MNLDTRGLPFPSFPAAKEPGKILEEVGCQAEPGEALGFGSEQKSDERIEAAGWPEVL